MIQEANYERVHCDRAMLHGTLDALTTPIAILDDRGVISMVNAAWREFGTRNGLSDPCFSVGRNYITIARDSRVAEGEAAARAIEALLRRTHTHSEVLYECSSPEAERWFVGRFTRFEVHDRVWVVAAHEDITANRLIERRNDELKHLRQAVHANEQVLRVIGHEMRTPLGCLRLGLESIIGQKPEGHLKALEALHEQVVHMSDFLQDSLHAARLRRGIQAWRWERVSLEQVTASAVREIEHLMVAKPVELKVWIEPRLEINGDEVALHRLIVNLLTNALNHTETGLVDLRIERLDKAADHIQIRVHDTGRGFHPDVVNALGETFALSEANLGGSAVTGSGMGLSICNGIAAAHGGDIRVRTGRGGSTVSVVLAANLDAPKPSEFAEVIDVERDDGENTGG